MNRAKLKKWLDDFFWDATIVTLALIGFALCFYFLFIHNPEYQLQAGVEIGKIKSTNPIRRRYSGTLAWGTIKKEGRLYLKDFVFVPEATTATVTFNNGNELELPAGTMVRFDEIFSNQVQITLLEGLLKKSKGITIETLVPKKVVSVRRKPIRKQSFLKWHEGMQIGTIESSGPVKRRNSSQGAWQTINGKGKLYEKDFLRVPEGVTAIAQLQNGKELVIPPKTLIRFRGTTADEVAVDLYEGKLPKTDGIRVSRLSKNSRLTNTETDERTQPSAESEAKMAKARTAAQAALRKTASLTKSYFPEPRQLEQQYYQASRELTSMLDSRPALYSLDNGSQHALLPLDNLNYFNLRPASPQAGVHFSYDDPHWVHFQWSKLPFDNLNYRLEVSKDKAFGTFWSKEVNENGVMAYVPTSGVYHWRVRASYRGQDAVLSPASSFSTRISDKNEEETQLVFASAGSNYHIEIATDKGFENVFVVTASIEPFCPADDLGPGNYFCRVKRIGSRRSDARIFRLSVLPSEIE